MRQSFRFIAVAPVFAASLAKGDNLTAYIEAAKRYSSEAQIAEMSLESAQSQRNSGYWALAPQPFASVVWSRNEFKSTNTIYRPNGATEEKTVVPLRSRDINIGLRLPLIDFPAWYKVGSVQDNLSSEIGRKDYAMNQLVQKVISTYLQVITNKSVLDAANQALKTAAASSQNLQDRNRLGTASAADVARARAQELTARANLSEAEGALSLAQNRLKDLSGMPTVGSALGAVSLASETALAEWNNAESTSRNPQIIAARSDALAGEKQLRQAQVELLPKLSAQVARKWTDNPAVQHSPQWAASLNLDWTPTFYAVSNTDSQESLARRAVLQSERVQSEVRLAIEEQWNLVRVNLDKVKAAEALEAAQKLELDFSNQRFASGTATAAALLEAEKSHFAANLAHIESRANLVMARFMLRLTTGTSLNGVLP